MTGTIIGASGLLVAGFVFGLLRHKLASMRPETASGAKKSKRVLTALVLAIIGFPVVTILLAKLFESDVLGWVFGLTLMLGVALVPCGAVFLIGMVLSSPFTRRRPAAGGASATRPDAPPAAPTLVVQIDRGSVHASDDAHSRRIALRPDTTLRAMIESALAEGFLPSISGGRATWVVESSGAVAGAGGKAIAVCAQQWREPVFLIPDDTPIAMHFGTAAPRLNFDYRCQVDPDEAVSELISKFMSGSKNDRSVVIG